VLVGTDQIEAVSNIITNTKWVLRLLKSEGIFLEVGLDEIIRLMHMADDNDMIGESEIRLDDDGRVVVLSGALKGEEGNIIKYNRRRGRVAVEFILGGKRFSIWFNVRMVSNG
jgi:transcriptional antiterminator NusG